MIGVELIPIVTYAEVEKLNTAIVIVAAALATRAHMSSSQSSRKSMQPPSPQSTGECMRVRVWTRV